MFIAFTAFGPIALASHLLVGAAGGLPGIDIQKSCRESSNALYGNTTADVFNSCVEDEKDASAKLAKDWAILPGRRQGTLRARSDLPAKLRRVAHGGEHLAKDSTAAPRG